MNEEPKDIKSIFAEAIEKKSPKERAAFLDKVCKGDSDLRSKVEDLLKAYNEAGDFLEEPAIGPSVTLGDPHLTEGPGTIISRYRLLEKIGEGGMACVYMAEQKRPIRRKVALKIIKLGMDTKQVIARFEAERQALAMMDHPNIAKVFDAGATETGRPYFVMELVRGVSITEYCDKNKLSTRARLDLFIPVCNAVQHAHHKGIIHRDLKPSNIMVTLHDGKPVPKIIDFGIAKATNHELTEKTVFTRYAQMIGTPEYMSPEQAEMSGLDIDTRSDVYSLGVVLYELLTGVPPFDPHTMASVALGEIRRIIQEEEPLRPSSKLSSLGEAATRVAQSHGTEVASLVKCLHRELEWIPLKAMRKDRTRRYQSALDLADDIQNYLDGAPLSAGPEFVLYRARKFVRRNRALVSGVAAVLAVLVAGVVVSTVFAIRAEHARVEAVGARAEAEAVSDFLRNDVLAPMDPRTMGSPFTTGRQDITVRSFLDAASERLKGKFADKPLVEASIRGTLGNTYLGLGLYEPAERHFKRALELCQAHLDAEDPKTPLYMLGLGWVYVEQMRYDEAETLLAEAEKGFERVLGEEDPNTLLSVAVLGWMYHLRGRVDDAERLFARAMETWRRAFGEECPGVGYCAHGLGFANHMKGRYEEAERLYKRSVEIIRRAGDDLGEMDTMEMLGKLYADLGRYDQAEQFCQKVLETKRRILGEEHPETLAARSDLAWLDVLRGRYEQAEPVLVEVLKTMRAAKQEDVYSLIATSWLAGLYVLQERYDEAEPLVVQVFGAAHRVLGEEHWGTPAADYLVGRLYVAQGRYDKAEEILAAAVETSGRVLGQEHPTTLSCTNALAVLRSKQKRYEEAGRLFNETWEGRRVKLGEDHHDTLESLHDFGVMYLEQGRYEQAEIKLLAAYEGRAGKLGPEHPMTLRSLHNLIQLYEAWGKPQEAEKWRKKLSGHKVAEQSQW